MAGDRDNGKLPDDEGLRAFLGTGFGVEAARDPMVAARETMRPEPPKRFYSQAGLEEREGGFALTLDGKLARTPARNLLMLKDRVLAEALAAEWQAQDTHIDPAAMPLTRLVNVALDRMADAMEPTREEIAAYAGNDMLLYRAETPDKLVERQARVWNPVLDWASERLGASLRTGTGIIHVPQDAAALEAIAAHLEGETDPPRLVALHVVTTLTGSAILALALSHGALDANGAWDAAHLDEDFQIELWGQDDEALARRAFRRREYDAAALVLKRPRG
jgi:chaperone required for assembly of F1-ATPase